MGKVEAKAKMAELAAAAMTKPAKVGEVMGATFTAPSGTRFQVYFSGGERWHVNGTRKSKAKALAAMIEGGAA